MKILGGNTLKKRVFKLLGLLIGIVILSFAALLGYATVTDYKPQQKETLLIRHPQHKTLEVIRPFTITTMNIGYGGLDAKQDFFMDGGKQSRASSRAQVEQNLQTTMQLLTEFNSDLYLLQEVDTDASRSYHVNEVAAIQEAFPQHGSVFAYNYKVAWVPVPLLKPMGKVESGLLSLSNYQITEQTRYNFPGEEEWPVQLFELDRAFIELRLPVDNGKELVVLNVHLSAFDKGGLIRKQQLQFLNDYIKQEAAKDNYVIVGGDWNHALPGTDPLSYKTTQTWPEWLQPLPDDFTPDGFVWAINGKIPTVRTLDVPYTKGTNFMAIIDGFLVSSNIEFSDIHTFDNQFASSDHHAVTGTFKLKP
jgi:endonuclease/exonuclease/phosphatase family metal-dependent hydrolase